MKRHMKTFGASAQQYKTENIGNHDKQCCHGNKCNHSQHRKIGNLGDQGEHATGKQWCSL